MFNGQHVLLLALSHLFISCTDNYIHIVTESYPIPLQIPKKLVQVKCFTDYNEIAQKCR